MKKFVTKTSTTVSAKVVLAVVITVIVIATSIIGVSLTAQESLNYSGASKPEIKPENEKPNVCCMFDQNGEGKTAWAEKSTECTAIGASYFCSGDKAIYAKNPTAEHPCSCTSCTTVESVSRVEIDCKAEVTVTGLMACGPYVFDNPFKKGPPCISIKATVDIRSKTPYTYNSKSDSCDPKKTEQSESLVSARCTDNDECEPDDPGSYESRDCRKVFSKGRYCVNGKCVKTIPKN